MQRAKELRDGKPSWNSAGGLVVRGYTSGIDGSVQPYGLVIPDDWKADDGKPRRLDFWLHGRAEQLSELAFIEDRLKNKGEFTPEGAIVCHLYGRFCNANKFAGERDLFEALADIQKHYKIDTQRLVVRGFSMGGAACWQFATHFPGMWAAAAPGAGFAETAEFFKVFAPGKTSPPWWEQVLWRWYDCTTMAANLANVPTVAYSGEIDGQKQAADIMVTYAKKEGIEFPHIIGAKMGHKYDAESKGKIEELVTTAAEARSDQVPQNFHFATYSLIYPRMRWLEVTRMEKQWERADVNVEITEGHLKLTTKNVSGLNLSLPKGTLSTKNKSTVTIDGVKFPSAGANGACWVVGIKVQGEWKNRARMGGLDIRDEDWAWLDAKSPSLCGPIDHAFMSSFLFVRPTGKPLNDAVGTWAKAELEHATEFWRRVFRGDAPVKDDTAVTADEIKTKHLVIWGDPSSNALLRRIAGIRVREKNEWATDPRKLPYQWTKDTLEFNGVKYDAANHAPILIFPNPLNSRKYVVLNSGPTFREEALLNNSDQTPKLPDWAIVNLDTPPDGKWPGQIIDAGFFNEQWALPAK
jgi:pimeloyl-ACP methyl ester carboxylesterase